MNSAGETIPHWWAQRNSTWGRRVWFTNPWGSPSSDNSRFSLRGYDYTELVNQWAPFYGIRPLIMHGEPQAEPWMFKESISELGGEVAACEGDDDNDCTPTLWKDYMLRSGLIAQNMRRIRSDIHTGDLSYVDITTNILEVFFSKNIQSNFNYRLQYSVVPRLEALLLLREQISEPWIREHKDSLVDYLEKKKPLAYAISIETRNFMSNYNWDRSTCLKSVVEKIERINRHLMLGSYLPCSEDNAITYPKLPCAAEPLQNNNRNCEDWTEPSTNCDADMTAEVPDYTQATCRNKTPATQVKMYMFNKMIGMETEEDYCWKFVNKLVTMVKQDCFIPWTTGSRLFKAKEALTVPACKRSVFNVSLRYSAWADINQVSSSYNGDSAYPFVYVSSWHAMDVDFAHPGLPNTRALASAEESDNLPLARALTVVDLSDLGTLDTIAMRRMSMDAKQMIKEHMTKGSVLGMFPENYEWQVYEGPINFATIVFINKTSSWINIVKRHDMDCKMDLKVVAIAPQTSIKLPPVFIDEYLTLTRGLIEKASPVETQNQYTEGYGCRCHHNTNVLEDVTVDRDIRGSHSYKVKCYGPKNQDTHIAAITKPVARPIETDNKRKFLRVNCGDRTINQIYSGSDLTPENFQEGYGCTCTDDQNV